MANDDKISRGKLALRLEEIESDHKERRIEEKLANAEQRRNQSHDDVTSRLRHSNEWKSSKTAAVQELLCSDASRRRDGIELKHEQAAARRELLRLGLVEKAASDIDGKALKVEELRRAEEAAAREKRLDIERKLQLAEQRKEDLLSTLVGKASVSSSSKKEAAKKSWISSLKEEKKLEARSAQKMSSAAQRKEKVSPSAATATPPVSKP